MVGIFGELGNRFKVSLFPSADRPRDVRKRAVQRWYGAAPCQLLGLVCEPGGCLFRRSLHLHFGACGLAAAGARAVAQGVPASLEDLSLDLRRI